MHLRIGDRFTDEDGEREVTSRPPTRSRGKVVNARVQQVGRPETEREVHWPAHEMLKVRRAQ